MKQTLAMHLRGSPDHTSTHEVAIRFAHAWLDNGHRLHSVFFSGAAAAVAHGWRQTDNKSAFDPQQQWEKLECPLIVCANAAKRCGIISVSAAPAQQSPNHLLAPGFTIGGLGSLAEAKQMASKFIEWVR